MVYNYRPLKYSQGGYSTTGSLGNGVTVVSYPMTFSGVPTVVGFAHAAGNIAVEYTTRINNVGKDKFNWDGHVISPWGASGEYAQIVTSTVQNSNGITWIAAGI